MITILLFSKDRAMQLDAVLRSFFLHCQDAKGNADIRVIYKVSNELHAQQYNELSQLYPQAKFIEQKNFRQDLIECIVHSHNSPWKSFFYKILARIGSIGSSTDSRVDAVMSRFVDLPKIRILKMLLPKNKPEAGVLFLVDDNVFVRRFVLADIIHSLANNPKAIGFSLRLGRNTRYCYAMRQRQSTPEFGLVSQNILKYNWTVAELDFAYPLEVSSSLYLMDVITPIVTCLSFGNPNELEAKIAARSYLFKEQYPELLCFDHSATFCNPINMVQTLYNNRAGEQVGLSIDYLSELFAKGKRINVRSLSGFTPNACHQEVELTFEDQPQQL
ncbi:MAG: hypothetical protein HY863_21165 [Chloroflexi bacterium]|nr:hypothetical protein [Chloroflexota bacterium]